LLSIEGGRGDSTITPRHEGKRPRREPKTLVTRDRFTAKTAKKKRDVADSVTDTKSEIWRCNQDIAVLVGEFMGGRKGQYQEAGGEG